MFRELMLYIMIVFQVLSNFDPVKEITENAISDLC